MLNVLISVFIIFMFTIGMPLIIAYFMINALKFTLLATFVITCFSLSFFSFAIGHHMGIKDGLKKVIDKVDE